MPRWIKAWMGEGLLWIPVVVPLCFGLVANPTFFPQGTDSIGYKSDLSQLKYTPIHSHPIVIIDRGEGSAQGCRLAAIPAGAWGWQFLGLLKQLTTNAEHGDFEGENEWVVG